MTTVLLLLLYYAVRSLAIGDLVMEWIT